MNKIRGVREEEREKRMHPIFWYPVDARCQPNKMLLSKNAMLLKSSKPSTSSPPSPPVPLPRFFHLETRLYEK